MEFQKFPKIPRYSRECVITEKIDGTNAQIRIEPIIKHTNMENDFRSMEWAVIESGDFLYGVVPASRNRWISPKKDNYGFARWVSDNSKELLKLGIGSHYGEWWGSGIQRNYGMDNRIFSLFDVNRWSDESIRPSCCGVVPVMFEGMFETSLINIAMDTLTSKGSVASPGFMNPEGIVIFHKQSSLLFKKTCKDDEKPKNSTDDA